MQTDVEFAATVCEYVFWEQLEQGWLPSMSLYLPGTHATHEELPSPVNPLSHRQSEGEALPDVDEECSTQTVQVPLPASGLNVPPWQGTQASP